MQPQENRTKLQLAAALKQQMQEKELSQIHVRELTEQCGLRRQTFYYHFQDVYALFDWSIRQERMMLMRQMGIALTWRQAIRMLFRATEENRLYYMAVLENRGREGLAQIFGGAVEQIQKECIAYYGNRGGGSASQEKTESWIQCGTGVLVTVLESYLCESIPQSADTIRTILEEGIQQMIDGVLYRQLKEWQTYEE